MIFQTYGNKITMSGGSISINGRPPELKGGDNVDRNSAYATELMSLVGTMNKPNGRFLVNEFSIEERGGCKVFSASIGRFNPAQQDRAWIAFRERVIPNDLPSSENPVEELNNVCSDLKITLKEETSDILDEAFAVLSTVRIIFIAKVHKSHDAIFTIRGNSFEPLIDKSLIAVSRVFMRILSEAQSCKNSSRTRLALQGLNATSIGNELTWRYLGDLAEEGKITESMDFLISCSGTLLMNDECLRYASFLGKCLTSDERIQFIRRLNEAEASSISDFLRLSWASQEISDGNLEVAIQYAREIQNPDMSVESTINVVNSLWTAGRFGEAKDLLEKINSTNTKDEWYLAKANELWVKGEGSAAKDLIDKINSYNTKDLWYLQKANELWAKGDRYAALDLIDKINSYNTKDHWYLEKANEVWVKGDRSSAKSLISRINSYNTKDHWYLAKAHQLWTNGDRSEAKEFIDKINSRNTQDQWYLLTANALWDNGDRSDAKELVYKINSYNTRDAWYLAKANMAWDSGDRSDAKNLIDKINSYNTKDQWYLSKANELWVLDMKSEAKDLASKINSSNTLKQWKLNHK